MCPGRKPSRPRNPDSTNMIAFALVALSTLTLAGIAVMLYALNHVVDGYEDAKGFHLGTEPIRNRMILSASFVEPATEPEEGWVEAVRISS